MNNFSLNSWKGDTNGTKAEDEKLAFYIWDEKLSFQQFRSSTPVILSITRNTAARNSAEVDGFLPNLLVLVEWHSLGENYWVENFSSGLQIASSLSEALGF